MTHIQLHIDGEWKDSSDGAAIDFWNPATGETAGTVAKAGKADLEHAVQAAERGFAVWKHVSAFDRSKLLRKAAESLRAKADDIAPLLTREQGKPLAEARGEIMSGAEIIEWFAEEARRTYGRIIPSRAINVRQMVTKEPVGPVAAFSPWNFPVNQAIRKISAALASGCSIILKGPEETPAACAEMVRIFINAGLPAGVLNLLYGNPAEISGFLIPHPAVKKVSFTGSTQVGKQLAALAGQYMKRATMELGGHAPAIVFDDAGVTAASERLAAFKFRNGGQICGAPTRFLVHDSVHDDFVEKFSRLAANIKVGDGMDSGTQMGPLANIRRVDAITGYVEDAVRRGAELVQGGHRIGNKGNFFEPTVLIDVPIEAAVMNEEPFGPIALVRRFFELDEAINEANRLEYGLASYVYTRSAERAASVSAKIEAGMVSINHSGLGLPETPFGGIKDSGYGSEGGLEAMEPYLISKFVTHAIE